jgi:hypothetical protein
MTTGQHDFDFLHGRWRVRNRKRVDVLDRESDKWVEFDATAEARPILGGGGNIDLLDALLPGGEPFQGMSLRLFDPRARLWRIWWSSTSRPGHLDPPVEGAFSDGHGQFLCDDVVGDRPIRLRFDWTDITGDSARWSQSFSYDAGQTWDPANWIMTFSRLAQ